MGLESSRSAGVGLCSCAVSTFHVLVGSWPSPLPPRREFFTMLARLACPSPPLSLLACGGIMI